MTQRIPAEGFAYDVTILYEKDYKKGRVMYDCYVHVVHGTKKDLILENASERSYPLNFELAIARAQQAIREHYVSMKKNQMLLDEDAIESEITEQLFKITLE